MSVHYLKRDDFSVSIHTQKAYLYTPGAFPLFLASSAPLSSYSLPLLIPALPYPPLWSPSLIPSFSKSKTWKEQM